MTKVSILPVPVANNGCVYHATAGARHSQGRTAGEALDAITSQLADDENNTLVILGRWQPDRFFDADQQQRLTELMARWRQARDSHTAFPEADQAQLQALVDAELAASGQRAAAIADEAGL